MTDEEKIIGCSDDRFEIIARARKHIIEATNIEMSPKEMEVLDNFLFRCWQMGWLKNDYKELEKENAELKAKIEELKKDKEWLDNTNNEQTKVILKLNEQIKLIESVAAANADLIQKMKCCRNEMLLKLSL